MISGNISAPHFADPCSIFVRVNFIVVEVSSDLLPQLSSNLDKIYSEYDLDMITIQTILISLVLDTAYVRH